MWRKLMWHLFNIRLRDQDDFYLAMTDDELSEYWRKRNTAVSPAQ